MPRASKQALALPKVEREAIGKELVVRGLVRKDLPDDRALVRMAVGVVKDGKTDKVHEKVVQKALLEGGDVVAVEVPVWAKDKSMTGHADVVRVDRDEDGVARITVADFKTEGEADFARFIPQVETYASMLRSQLGKGGDGVLFDCVLFNKDAAWRWEPGILDRLAAADPAVKRVLDEGHKKRKVDR